MSGTLRIETGETRTVEGTERYHTIGQEDDSTLAQTDGSTLEQFEPLWLDDVGIDPLEIEQPVELTPTTLTLRIRADADNLEEIRTLDVAGDHTVRIGAGGAFEVIDHGGGVVSVDPPDALSPPLDAHDAVVTAYHEEQLGAADDGRPSRWRAELELHRVSNRTPAFDAIETYDHELAIGEGQTHTVEGTERHDRIRQADGSTLVQPHGATLITTNDWPELVIETDRSRLTIDRAHVEVDAAEGDTAGRWWTVTTRLDDDHAAVIADELSHPDGVVVHHVPGGEDVVSSPEGQLTSIHPPDGADIEAGTWAVGTWTLTQTAVGRWRLELETVRIGNH